jgi:hypothetical protein
MRKQLLSIHIGMRSQVGDGFPIRRALPAVGLDHLDPFLVLDYAGPAYFPPAQEPRGVDQHPHRGFETVSIVFQGELEHRDSAGNSGSLGPGDVQWMTAASGLVHEEKHSRAFTEQGGVLEMVQLWVNLPARLKMQAPAYQDIPSARIPLVELPGGSRIRLIAGELEGQQGAARTFTPIFLFDIHLPAGQRLEIPVAEGHNAGLFLRKGQLQIEGRSVAEAQMAVFSPVGSSVEAEALEDSQLLLLGGEPIAEPVASHGPFVMNTRQELVQAFQDYQSGKMGRL